MITKDEVASPDYRAVLQKRYTMPGWGASGASWALVVKAFAQSINAQTILDYGCGRGTLKKALVGWDVREYDPGIVGKDELPAPADLVVATDVLEHIEPELLDNVLEHIRSLAKIGIFFNIATSAAKEILPDGRNAHLIIKPPMWWHDRLSRAKLWPTHEATAKGYNVWIKVA